jgi:hypothetical protein
MCVAGEILLCQLSRASAYLLAFKQPACFVHAQHDKIRLSSALCLEFDVDQLFAVECSVATSARRSTHAAVLCMLGRMLLTCDSDDDELYLLLQCGSSWLGCRSIVQVLCSLWLVSSFLQHQREVAPVLCEVDMQINVDL